LTQFRPCIDIHEGSVKQIVGGTLDDQGAKTNFVSEYSPAYYAELYKEKKLQGGHVISLGKGNETAVSSALGAWPKGMQYGGGVNLENAASFLEKGASQVIVTSWLFQDGEFSFDRLNQLVQEIGKENLVLDLSCRKVNEGWFISTNRWQTITSTEITAESLKELSSYCAEFLIHAADVEGLQSGMDLELIELLGVHVNVPTTYAGGARGLADLDKVKRLSNGKLDLTIGSALDIFGGSGVTLEEFINWNKKVK
jgi:phosphoribosylformimino-5-aminoimidazole carboxamide ribotide isomerase